MPEGNTAMSARCLTGIPSSVPCSLVNVRTTMQTGELNSYKPYHVHRCVAVSILQACS